MWLIKEVISSSQHQVWTISGQYLCPLGEHSKYEKRPISLLGAYTYLLGEGGGGGMEHEANSHLLFPSLQFGSVYKVQFIDYLSRLLVF